MKSRADQSIDLIYLLRCCLWLKRVSLRVMYRILDLRVVLGLGCKNNTDCLTIQMAEKFANILIVQMRPICYEKIKCSQPSCRLTFKASFQSGK